MAQRLAHDCCSVGGRIGYHWNSQKRGSRAGRTNGSAHHRLDSRHDVHVGCVGRTADAVGAFTLADATRKCGRSSVGTDNGAMSLQLKGRSAVAYSAVKSIL